MIDHKKIMSSEKQKGGPLTLSTVNERAVAARTVIRE
jgi:hypothetical protein